MRIFKLIAAVILLMASVLEFSLPTEVSAPTFALTCLVFGVGMLYFWWDEVRRHYDKGFFADRWRMLKSWFHGESVPRTREYTSHASWVASLMVPSLFGRVWDAPEHVETDLEFAIYDQSLGLFEHHHVHVFVSGKNRYAVVFATEDDRFAFLKSMLRW